MFRPWRTAGPAESNGEADPMRPLMEGPEDLELGL